MDQQQFKEFMGPVMERIAGGALDAGLEADLNRAFPAEIGRASCRERV